MKRILLFTLFCFIIFNAISQNFSIRGKVINTGNESLPGATVLLLQPSDSTMVDFALTNNNGIFEIPEVKRNNYLLRISFVGFDSHFQAITPPEGRLLDLGTIVMTNEGITLSVVSITGERIPITVRGDTIDYDVQAFSPQVGEVVEDMLRRMPGIIVDDEGEVIAQGQTVRRVLVNGREFFGRDPKMATRNIAATDVDRVQVFDERSEQAKFTGIDDGFRERTMNLELKEDRRNQVFGTVSAGYGPDDRFQGRANINQFNNRGQLSILAMGNNVNQPNFSIADYLNFAGGVQSIMRSGGGFGGDTGGIPVSFDGLPSSDGLKNSWAGGVNAFRKLGRITEVTASYFYNQLDHDLIQSIERENFLPTGNFFFNQDSDQNSKNHNHRVNLRIENKFNEGSNLMLTANGSLNNTIRNQTSFSENLNSENFVRNQSNQLTEAEGDSYNFETNLLWRQRFNKPGRTITIGSAISMRNNDQLAFLEATNQFFGPGSIVEELIQNHNNNTFNRNLSANIAYTEPIGNRLFLEANYRISNNFNEVDQRVFDLVDGVEQQNTLLTNKFDNTFLNQNAGISISLNRDNFNMTVSANYQFSNLKGNILIGNQTIDRNFNHLLPRIRFNYQFTQFRGLDITYETSVREPSALQLQPLIDNRDPLNLFEGNPFLKPSYRHQIGVNYRSFNVLTSFGVFGNLTARYETDAITNSTSIDENFIRTVKPVNVRDNIFLNAAGNVFIGLDKIKSRLNFSANYSHFQNVNVINNSEQRIANNILGGQLSIRFSPNASFEQRFTAALNTQLTKYQFRTLEQAFLSQTYSSNTGVTFGEQLRAEVNFRYMIYQGRTADFDRTIPMLNASLGYRVLKGNAGELRLSAHNILDKDLGVTNNVTDNFIQRQLTNSLGRYFLLTFTYSLNRSLNVIEDQVRVRMAM